MSPRRSKKAPPHRVTAYVDTNIFLHFQPFDQIPWLKELKADFVALRVPPDVIGELNKHKDGHKVTHMKERAGKILRRIMNIALTNEGRVGDSGTVTITCEQHAPGFDLQARGFDSAISDDRILAAVLDYKERHPDEYVVLVTDDFGAGLRAHGYGVVPLGLSETLRIAPSPDEKQQRINELEERVRSMEKVGLRLHLSFPGGASECTLTVEPDTIVTDGDAKAYADAQVAKLAPHQTGAAYQQMARSQHKLLDDEILSSFVPTITAAARMFAEKAHANLMSFHSKCAAYFSATWKHSNDMRRTKEIRLELENTGTGPAEDVYVRVRLPKGIIIYPQGVPTDAPVPPIPPGTSAKPEQRRGQKAKPPVQHAFEYVGPQELAEHWDVRFRLPRLNHHLAEQVIGLHIRFPTPVAVSSFEIQYRVSAGNATDAVDGRLSVIVNPPPKRMPRRIATRPGK